MLQCQKTAQMITTTCALLNFISSSEISTQNHDSRVGFTLSCSCVFEQRDGVSDRLVRRRRGGWKCGVGREPIAVVRIEGWSVRWW